MERLAKSNAEWRALQAYLQDYDAKNPIRYKLYRYGRDRVLARRWGGVR